MSTATQLSLNDRAILGALFDPEASLDRSTNTIQTSTPTTSPDLTSIINAEHEAVQLLNTPNPSPQDVATSITLLSTLIATNPTYASAYNNRAQANRLLPNSSTSSEITSQILTDLTTAISLSTPSSPLTPLPSHTAHVLASAHTHRGYLLLKASTSPPFFSLLTSLCPTMYPLLARLTSPAAAEELASQDFAVAGRYGNKTAQSVAVKTNPYAKLCGQIVREALQREIREFYEGGDGVSV